MAAKVLRRYFREVIVPNQFLRVVCLLITVCFVLGYCTKASAQATDRTLTAECDFTTSPPMCRVGAAELAGLIKNNNLGWELAGTELKALKEAGPKCGTLEVQSPAKPIPPALKNFKKDRDA